MHRHAATVEVVEYLLTRADDTNIYGYDVINATGRPAGSVYPILARLASRGWLKAGPPALAGQRREYRWNGKQALADARTWLDAPSRSAA